MEITFGSKIGDGGFSNVWEGSDSLGRAIAVKIIRSSAAVVSSAIDHAKALARLNHPNVVAVYSIERVKDPESGEQVDAIVMERLAGETLSSRLTREALTQADVLQIGSAIIDGLEHIHDAGLTHGDFHADNVMVNGSVAKIIDVLYTDSLALLSNASKDARFRKDIVNLRMMLCDVIFASQVDPEAATEFNNALGVRPTLPELRAAFERAVDSARRADYDVKVVRSLKRIRDEGFVESDLYARAVASETPTEITKSLLERLLTEGGLEKRHRNYLKLLWDRLTVSEKRGVSEKLGDVLDSEVPNGRWPSPLHMLAAFGKEGWDSLAPVTKLRLEGVIVNDILAGHFDIYGPNVAQGGALGTWAQIFWSRFVDLDRLVDNIVARLRSGWYGQNYVGKYFMWLLPTMGNTPARRNRLASAIAHALKNDAKVVAQWLHTLPADWQDQINTINHPPIPDDQPLTDDDIPF